MTTAAPPPDVTALRAALERQLDHADRVIDPWHEGFSESSEQAALADLAAATRAYLALRDVVPGPGTRLGKALALADSGPGPITTFKRLMLLDQSVRFHVAALGEPVRRQGD